MIKNVLGLCALLMCFMMASCGGSPTNKFTERKKEKQKEEVKVELVNKNDKPADRIKSLAENIKKNGNNWTDKAIWESVMVESANGLIEFMESDPSKEEFEQFMNAYDDFTTAIREIDNKKAITAKENAGKNMRTKHADIDKKADKAFAKYSRMEYEFKKYRNKTKQEVK